MTIAGLIVLEIVELFVKKRIRCPRCGTDFRKERLAKVGRWSLDLRMAADLWDACPHCGVSFNDPCPQLPSGSPLLGGLRAHTPDWREVEEN